MKVEVICRKFECRKDIHYKTYIYIYIYYKQSFDIFRSEINVVCCVGSVQMQIEI